MGLSLLHIVQGSKFPRQILVSAGFQTELPELVELEENRAIHT